MMIETTENTEQKHYPWDEGMPTKPDVDLLVKTWPDPQVGDVFAYEEVEEIIGVSRKTRYSRFSAITTAWRKRMLNDKGAVIECKPNEAFFVASSDQVASVTHGVFDTMRRKAKKHRKKLIAGTKEEGCDKARIEHQCRLLHEVEQHTKKSKMNLIPKTESEPLPRIEPPQRKADQ